MTSLNAERRVARAAPEAFAIFSRPVMDLLPAIVGPDERTWRLQTREGLIRVGFIGSIGDVWILPDGSHRRSLAIRPDPNAPGAMLTAALTPAIEGELSLETTPEGQARLRFVGTTRARSPITGAFARLLIGDPLTRSGVDTLLDQIAEALADPHS